MTLRIGDKGSIVSAFQLALLRAGFLSEKPDGVFGDLTQNAVFEFQKAFGLTADGIIGTDTEKYLSQFIKGFFIKKIQKNDTIWKISIDTGTPISYILTANPLIDVYNLIPGENITVPYNFSVTATDIPYSYYLTENIIMGLKYRYPFIETETIGKSVMNNNISSIVIGTGQKEIFINAGFHSNEWLNIPVILKFTEEYLKAISENKTFYGYNAKELYNSTKVHLVPLVNPDGLDLVTNALKDGEYYRKAQAISNNYPDIPFPDGWKANINGVDLNLQFPANWEKAKEIKFSQGFTKPSPIEYVGTAPLSEPEAAVIFEYTQKNNFKLILAYHSQGEIIYWKYEDFLPPESKRIGEILSNASGYPLEITPYDSSYAGYKDWFIERYNRPGYTVETGIGSNPLPIEQFNKIYSDNKVLLAAAIFETSML